MSNETQHVQQARHNISFLSTIVSDTSNRDWIATVCFYSAVHLIEAVVYRIGFINYNGKTYQFKDSNRLDTEKMIGLRLSPHDKRQIALDHLDGNVADHYKSMRELCDNGRYHCNMPAHNEAKACVEEHLSSLIAWVSSKLGITIEFDLVYPDISEPSGDGGEETTAETS